MQPHLEREWALISDGHQMVIAMDEVGRGAIAGPVTVGAGIWLAELDDVPDGIRDSKLVVEAKRPELADRANRWLHTTSVGNATAAEVDKMGITAALGLAGNRALAALRERARFEGAVVLLDGQHDWLSASLPFDLPVVTQVKADRDCASVAAVSLVAKVSRDSEMILADQRYPEYGFSSHKGYGSATHFHAIEKYGPCELHRLTWLRPTELPLADD